MNKGRLDYRFTRYAVFGLLWLLTLMGLSNPSMAQSTDSKQDKLVIQYQLSNQTNQNQHVILKGLAGFKQRLDGPNACGNPIVLKQQAYCLLTLELSAPDQSIGKQIDKLMLCDQTAQSNCLPLTSNRLLSVKPLAPDIAIPSAFACPTISLITNGASDSLTIQNNSTTTTAYNIAANFSGTALSGNVTESGNTCATVAPGGQCQLTFTPGANVVPVTTFPIQGSNTAVLEATMEIVSSVVVTSVNPTVGPESGGTGITITGSGFTGATAVTFDGVAATSVNVVNSTTITAVTPAGAIGSGDVVVTTPMGMGTLSNGYTYQANAAGGSTGGGVIGCLGGAPFLNLVSQPTDQPTQVWSPANSVTLATSNNDGDSNTGLIVADQGAGVYAARTCSDYEIDSQDNTPCQAGNACYNDWFLPATNQLACLITNGASIGGFTSTDYWSSTETNLSQAVSRAYPSNAATPGTAKNSNRRFRCVRVFTP